MNTNMYDKYYKKQNEVTVIPLAEPTNEKPLSTAEEATFFVVSIVLATVPTKWNEEYNNGNTNTLHIIISILNI